MSGRPVVLLLGWLGSRGRYLAKYRKLWEGMGARVVQFQPGIVQTAVPGVADRTLLRLMRGINISYSNLCSLQGAAPPVLVHVMSNGGFISYGTMLHLTALLRHSKLGGLPPAPGATAASLEADRWAWHRPGGLPATEASANSNSSSGSSGSSGSDPSGGGSTSHAHGYDGQRAHWALSDPRKVAVLSAFRQVVHHTQGIVLDSAPSMATAHIWSRGMLSALLSKPAHDIPEEHPVALGLVRQLMERYLLLPPIVQRIGEVRHAWQYHAPSCPQLYLYSKADALIPYQHVERFMEQQAALGRPVHHHCWDDTAHCEHMRKHPEQYRSLVRSFAERCLHGAPPPQGLT